MREDVDRRIAEHRAEQDALVASLAGPRLEWPFRQMIPFSTSATELTDTTWLGRVRIGNQSRLGHTPQLLWPGDRAWALATEIDLDSTLVGGPSGLIEEILGDPRLEAFAVHEGDELP